MRAKCGVALLAFAWALSACALTHPSAPSEPGPPPATKKLMQTEDLAFLRVRPATHPQRGRIIYIGVYGGQVPSWDGARYFIPKDWPAYQKLSRGEEDYRRIAYHDSLMHVLALEIARLFPESITLMIKGDGEVVADVARYLYSPGDRLYLIGHSQGAAAVADAALRLKDVGVPIAMLIEMESFLGHPIVPPNVLQAFNFYVPTTFSICPGRVKLEAEVPAATRVHNIAVADPWGPFNGTCAPHRNIDSDSRVWKPVLQYIVDSESAGATPDAPLQPARAGGPGR
jgi:pimeloyl-ACP methyl ester carboxylesterase